MKKTWHWVVAITLLVLVIAGIRIYLLWWERNQPVVQKQGWHETQKLTNDDVVSIRKLYINDLKSAKDLVGKTVWVKAGYQLSAYPYAGGRVNFNAKPMILPTVEKLEVKNIVTQAVPASLNNRIPHGTKQVFLVFTQRGETATHATAIGVMQGTDETYYCDELFFYDDPHLIYKHWPADIWAAVDAHQPKTGMNEVQATMALGQVQQSSSSSIGNRTIHYDADGKKWVVTFVDDKATEVKAE